MYSKKYRPLKKQRFFALLFLFYLLSFFISSFLKGYDILTIQGLLGHKDVKTTMIYAHALRLQPVSLAVKSLLDW